MIRQQAPKGLCHREAMSALAGANRRCEATSAHSSAPSLRRDAPASEGINLLQYMDVNWNEVKNIEQLTELLKI